MRLLTIIIAIVLADFSEGSDMHQILEGDRNQELIALKGPLKSGIGKKVEIVGHVTSLPRKGNATHIVVSEIGKTKIAKPIRINLEVLPQVSLQFAEGIDYRITGFQTLALTGLPTWVQEAVGPIQAKVIAAEWYFVAVASVPVERPEKPSGSNLFFE